MPTSPRERCAEFHQVIIRTAGAPVEWQTGDQFAQSARKLAPLSCPGLVGAIGLRPDWLASLTNSRVTSGSRL